MCGRYNLVPTETITARFDAQQEQLMLLPRYNVAPNQSMPVVVGTDSRRVVMMRWGLVPSWSKEPSVTFSTINARAETVTKSPVFRTPFRRQRCLVPATGFYEWERMPHGKQPYCFQLKEGQLFAFAGLYDIWRDTAGNQHYSYAIITTAPNGLVAPVHNRMPVVLRRDDEDRWLDSGAKPEELQSLLAPYDAASMEVFPVSRGTNNPANDNHSLMRPLVA